MIIFETKFNLHYTLLGILPFTALEVKWKSLGRGSLNCEQKKGRKRA